MKYLFCSEDGNEQFEVASDMEISQEKLQLVDDNEAEIIRWNADADRFEVVVLDEEVIEAEGEDEEDEKRYTVDHWAQL